jgi:hypothetical protein
MPVINPRLFYAFALLALIANPACPGIESNNVPAQSVTAENDAPIASLRASGHTADVAPALETMHVNGTFDA